MSQVTVADNKLSSSLTALRKVYEVDARPWVVAYSGGKDSTAVTRFQKSFLRIAMNSPTDDLGFQIRVRSI